MYHSKCTPLSEFINFACLRRKLQNSRDEIWRQRMCFTYIDDVEWNELSKQQRQLGWVGYFCSGAAAGFIGDTVIHCKS